MHRERFDALAKLLAATGSRRAALGAILGAGILGRGPDALAKPRRRKGKSRKRRKTRRRGGNAGGQPPDPTPGPCCGTSQCAPPAPAGIRSGCDFGGATFAGANLNVSTFRGIDGRDANFDRTENRASDFAGACLQGASFRGADLRGATWSGACLFETDFTDAKPDDDAAGFADALLCGTRMPDGSVDDRDCGRATSCCRRRPGPGESCQSAAECANQPCRTKACQDGQCLYATAPDGPSPNAQCASRCCSGACCPADAAACDPQGRCCAPNCAGRDCGPDDCGGVCGDCPTGGVCDEASGACRCTAESCPDGCCSNGPGNRGVCRPGGQTHSCGMGGSRCESCNQEQTCQDRNCVDCSPVCACAGQCVCTSPDAANVVCGQGSDCFCVVSREGQPLCAGDGVSLVNPCAVDADCHAAGYPGAFCVDPASPTASENFCSFGTAFCAIPCQT